MHSFTRFIIAAAAASMAVLSASAQEPSPSESIWLCSGQSNMELPISRCMDVVADAVADYSCSEVSYTKVPITFRFNGPQSELPKCEWSTLEAGKISSWGALCYFLGRYLNERTGESVRIVNSSVGGSPIEAWLPEEVLPDYALAQLRECQDSAWMAQTLYHNTHLYGEWQAQLDATPTDPKARWRRMPLFSTKWSTDDEGKPIYGSHFFKKTFRLSARKAAAGEAILHLGAIVDADSVFVNGTYVGNTTYQYPPRNYKVPAGILKKGRNTIDVHLQSHAGGPAHFVQDKQYALETAEGSVSLLKGWKYKAGARMPARDAEVFLQYKPAGLYNAMIAPLAGRNIEGVVWYQGESNAGQDNYADLLKTLIGCWRELFGRPDLPFYIIELANFEHSELETAETSGWVRLQEAQKQVCDEMEGVYFVPNRDLGEWNDIHPQDKMTLGSRLVDTILSSRN